MRRYYDDSYTREFTARVIERTQVGGHPAVVLDQTYFYPTSGGQPNDTGTIDGAAVIDVIAREGDAAVVHVLASELAADSVTCVVDWARRFDHMQHHTGQHILSQAFVEVAGANTIGFHLSPDSVTIDLDKVDLSADAVSRVEDLANDVIFADRPVTARTVGRDDLDGVRVRKIPDHLLTDGLRVIDIDGFDMTACGGTHVARTGEIGMIKVLRMEKRGDKLRVEFRCGGRALRDYRDKNALANQLTAALTCKQDEAPAAVARLQEDFKAAQRSLKAAVQQLIDYEAAQILRDTPEINGLRVVKMTFEDRDVGELRTLAGKLTRSAPVVVLLGAVGGEKSQLIFARSEELSQDMNTLLKAVMPLLDGGRGGGQAAMAQGGGVARFDQLVSALDAAEVMLRGQQG